MSAETTHPAFPSHETLAAFTDGRLDQETRRQVIEHMSGCAECRDVVIGSAMRRRETPRSKRTIGFARILAVAATLSVIAGVAFFFTRRQAKSDVSIAELAMSRPSETRLSGFPFRPVRPVMRGEGRDSTPEAENWRLLVAADRIRETARTKPTANNLHQLGVVYLLLGNPGEAVTALERAVVTQSGDSDVDAAVTRSTDAPLLCDLGAAYYECGRSESRPDQFVKALNAADRAWSLSKSPEAAWNRAEALEALHQNASAARAWRDVLDTERDGTWRKEAVRHASELHPQSLLGRPDLLRKEVVRTLIPAWAAALDSGDTRKAADVMARAVASASELETRYHNDAILRMLRSLRDDRNDVVPLLRRGAVSEGDDSHKHRSDVLAEVAGRFRELHSPYAVAAAVDAARESFLANDYDRVLAICATALKDDSAKSDTGAAGELHWLRGLSLLATGAVADAVSAYQAACSLFAVTHEDARTAAALARLAEAQDYAGDVGNAWQSRQRSFLLALATGDAATLSSTTYAAAIAADDDRLPYAALDLLTSIDRSAATLRVDVPLLRASVLREIGQTDRARLNVAVAVGEAGGLYRGEANERVKANAGMASAAISGDPSSLTEPIAFFARSHNEFALTQALVRRAEILFTRGDHAAAESDYLNAIAIVESESLQSRDVTIRAQLLDTATSSYDAIIAAALSRHDIARCFAYAERARMLAFAKPGAFTAIADPRTVAHEALLHDDIVVEFAVLSDRLIVWCFRDGTATVQEQAVRRDELSALVERARQFDATALERLGRILLVGIDLHSARRLVFVPEKELRGVPFAALKEPRTASFLIRDHAVRVVPSATWYCRSSDPVGDGGASVFAVGDPVLNRQVYASLAMLPHARAETLAVASLYRAPTVLLGADATPRHFIAGALNATIIHFAGHAVTDVRDPLLSGLVLSPDASAESGTLYARDIIAMRLRHAPTVVLSACATASGRGYTRGVNNVALAFLAAGARCVIAATAPVDDDAAFALVREYHRRLATGEDSADALRHAQLRILDGGNPQLDGVARWGAFEVIG